MRRLASLMAAVVATSAVVLLGTVGPVGSQLPGERQTITLFDPRATEYERNFNEGKKGVSPGDVSLSSSRSSLTPIHARRPGS